MSAALAALAPLVRRLPLDETVRGEPWLSAMLGAGLVLIVAARDIDRSRATTVATKRMNSSIVASRSRTAGSYAVLLAARGRAGMDMETIGRIALNATLQDRWLASVERRLVEQSIDPIVELACHWVLKEAYGKALGRGLDLLLDGLAFGGRDDTIVLEGMPGRRREKNWTFGLYRHADTLIGTARQL